MEVLAVVPIAQYELLHDTSCHALPTGPAVGGAAHRYVPEERGG
jgi:hypothetical protein